MNEDVVRHFVAVSLIRNLNHINAKKLIAAAGDVRNVFNEHPHFTGKVRLSNSILSQLRNQRLLDMADAEMRKAEALGIQIICIDDHLYPYRLKQCVDAPLILFLKGQMNLNDSAFISVVGTRKASNYGKEICRQLIEGLSEYNVVVLSGLALGIDTCAHESALDFGLKTGAVLGHGLDRIYPGQNKALARRILDRGCLISDFAFSSSVLPINFPSRNRIIAGMSDATIVIESAVRGGSLITANLANSYNREVFAFPGKVSDTYSAGCNQLIKNQKAALIENSEDLIRYMNWDEVVKKARQKSLFVDLTEDEKILTDYIRENSPARIDAISRTTGISIGKTATILLHLEFKNVVTSLPGKMYEIRA